MSNRGPREYVPGWPPESPTNPTLIDLDHAWRKHGWIPRTSSLPTASAHYRGRMLILEGGGGVADTLRCCLKAAGGTYSWVIVATG